MEQTFGVAVSVREIFDYPTLAELSTFLASKGSASAPPAQPHHESSDPGSRALTSFKDGHMDLEQIRALIDQGILS